MAEITYRDLDSVHSGLKRTRAKEETIWNEIALSLEEDGGEGFDVRSTDSRNRPSYDSTPLHAKDEFVGSLFTEAINPADPWVAVTIDDKDRKKFRPVADWLYTASAKIAASFDTSVSGFYVEMVPVLADMAAFGSGFIGQEENPGGDSLIIDRARSIRGMFKDVDANGDTSRLHEEFMLTGLQAKGKFGDGASGFKDDESIQFVHALFKNPDYDPNRRGNRFMRWRSAYVSPDKKDFGLVEGYHERPIHEIEWQRKSGRAWARGIGHKVRADLGMLDEVARSVAIGAQFAAEPMWLVHNEDVMTAADIQPSAIIAGGMSGQTGKRTVETVDMGDNLVLPMNIHEKIKAAVREGFKFSLMQIASRPQMTASEFLGWKEEKLRVLAPNLVTVHRGMAPLIRRRAGILLRNGIIPPPPPELEGVPLKLEFRSPFDQAQKAARARGKMQLITAGLNARELDPEAADNLVVDNLMRGIADGLTGDPGDVRDPREVAQRRQMRAQAQQQDVDLARGAQQAGIVAEVAHAQKAMSTVGNGKGRAA